MNLLENCLDVLVLLFLLSAQSACFYCFLCNGRSCAVPAPFFFCCSVCCAVSLLPFCCSYVGQKAQFHDENRPDDGQARRAQDRPRLPRGRKTPAVSAALPAMPWRNRDNASALVHTHARTHELKPSTTHRITAPTRRNTCASSRTGAARLKSANMLLATPKSSSLPS